MKKTTGLLEAAWERWRADWYFYALRITHNAADAEDAVGEALRRTLSANPTLVSPRHARNYVAQAIRSVAAAMHKRRQQRSTFLEDLRRSPPATEQALFEHTVATEEAERLRSIMRRALAEMEPTLREAVELYYDPAGVATFRDVARAQGVSVRTAHKRVVAGRRLIAKVIEAPE